jgi:hypothetical protein
MYLLRQLGPPANELLILNIASDDVRAALTYGMVRRIYLFLLIIFLQGRY